MANEYLIYCDDYKRKSIKEMLKYNKGKKPKYCGVDKFKLLTGRVHCPSCINPVGFIQRHRDNTISGWFCYRCDRCGCDIDWSDADKNIGVLIDLVHL